MDMIFPFLIKGVVVHGQKRGRLLGFPTANISPDAFDINVVEPGVYSSKITIEGETFKAATSIGAVSTFNQDYPTIESHIINFNQDIYDQEVTLVLTSRIREMEKFENISDLIEQIRKDVEQVLLA